MSALKPTSFKRRILVKDLNPYITCGLCRGYLIDATTLIECLHVFCRACVLRHFENKLRCPTCSLVYKKKSYPYFRSDPTIQALVFKLVPGLYNKEVQRREDFYRNTAARAGSSCSEDSVLGELNEDQEEWQIPSLCGDEYQFLSPDDAVSLSLEYYQPSLDHNSIVKTSTVPSDQNITNLSDGEKNVHNCDNNCNCVNKNNNLYSVNNVSEVEQSEDLKKADTDSEKVVDQQKDKKKCDRRYLRCPAAVTMSLLQKFLRMKHALSTEHRVDIIHEGEVLPSYFTLIDVAYTFKWQRLKPLRFFYRIFTPVKIQPIKIITTSSGKHKQLQVVPAKSHQIVETKTESIQDVITDIDDQNIRNKETLMTNLQLQSITKPPQIFTSRLNRADEVKKDRHQKDEEAQCVYEYEEPDKEEIRAFAEKRDLEWALQKQLDEAKERYRISKKRKKSKHKNNLLYKKRKLHAEITSSESLQKEESLKLKVKLTQPNGYKHKHHRSSQNVEHVHDSAGSQRELSSKEKLLQMRQVRHKHIAKLEKFHPVETSEKPCQTGSSTTAEVTHETPAKPLLAEPVPPTKVIRNDLPNKANTKETCLQKLPTVQLERNPQTEQQAQQTFLKTFQSYTEKHVQRNGLPQSHPYSSEKTGTHTSQVAKSLEKKIAKLHQQYVTVETKQSRQEDINKGPVEVGVPKEKPLILNSQFSTGFTVSKVETGNKRSAADLDHQKIQEKRPSLEITLISNSSEESKSPTKRPLPATIPLDKIRRSISRMVGVSIVPKATQVADTSLALDLSKPNKNSEAASKVLEQPPSKLLNGLTSVPVRSHTPEKNMQLSNLQMLSKVASEHPSINNKRPQMPSLNTLRIPIPNANPKANLAKLPKLNEINKTQFRLPNPQVRNMRPNQNQSIRNIPNPSLLVRQQNQNRLNSLTNNSTLPDSKPNSTFDATKDEKGKTVAEEINMKQPLDKPNSLTVTSV